MYLTLLNLLIKYTFECIFALNIYLHYFAELYQINSLFIFFEFTINLLKKIIINFKFDSN